MSTSYRPGTPEDATACARIIRGWGEEVDWIDPMDDLAPMSAFWAKIFARHPVWIALEAGEVVGFSNREERHLCGLYVDHQARGRGVGKRLLDLAREDQPRMIAWSYEDNRAARRFYRREGFVERCREVEEGTGLMNVEHLWTRPA
ncbi:GNAT family N-acetyltransferase [Oceanicola sp. 502str15]|uniref:GNAT family N-acetyltransferase n=1 Tax=Oceanicola sp. 502str15 TaxID=2696061 RepID=UPI0020942624|nr:GNAT family N-acetyltransferase [Oceanicola sp. 502str15]MCO6382162.1 GNAT family N-acetyltransferase [Oceanicola sp. 502str15]